MPAGNSDYDDSDAENVESGDEQDHRLNREQLNQAMKLTQISEGQDPNAAYKERSEMREEYFTMTNKVLEATKELKETGQTELMNTEEGFDEIEEMLKKGQGFYQKMGASTKELACDAAYMFSMGQLLLAGAQRLQMAHVTKVLRPKEFVEKIIEVVSSSEETPLRLVSSDPATADLLDDSDDEEFYRPKNAEKRLPEGVENDGLMPATAWAAIGRRFGLCLKIPATMSYFRPLLQDTAPLPTQPKAKKERLPKEDRSKAKAVVLSEKDKNHDDPDQSVTKELDAIRKSLRRVMKKEKSHIISYYGFVIDPDDFSRSVENMFYTSFLVKDNYIKIEIDPRKGVPLIVLQGAGEDDDGAAASPTRPTAAARTPATPTTGATVTAPATPAEAAAAAAVHCTATQQAIVGFAYDIWEGMIDCLNITEAAIRR
ncbi:hypothetical protein PFISCL1PPCAC_18749 [Pristionchus fissidentatus]|uniref:Non-structural maintenance of chromosomes element 4 n=1 Tax=Pristionchus fissidentatus TaxID=1538716 RepID=A0AAV5W8Y2_9BILA|nr:hypothetical protein PFISCL1PPCAC_18749 [Pristionchus fissidentatus]